MVLENIAEKEIMLETSIISIGIPVQLEGITVTPSFVSTCVCVYIRVFLACGRSTSHSFHPSSFKLYM